MAVAPDLYHVTGWSTLFARTTGPFAHLSLFHAYLSDVNREAGVLSERVLEEAWERWEYPWHLAGFDAKQRQLSVPHLEMNSLGSGSYRPHAQPWLDRVRQEVAASLPFVNDAAESAFENWLGQVASKTAGEFRRRNHPVAGLVHPPPPAGKHARLPGGQGAANGPDKPLNWGNTWSG